MTLKARDEAVEMIVLRFGFLPHRFRWRGRCCEVEALEECWTEVGRQEAERHFRVQCSAGTLVLLQNLATGVWRLRPACRLSVLALVLRRGHHAAPKSPMGIPIQCGRPPAEGKAGHAPALVGAIWPLSGVRRTEGG
jgi:hypothetical protein